MSIAAAAALCYWKWRHNRKWRQSRDRKWRHNRKWRQSRDRKWGHNRKWRHRKWRHFTGLFSYYSSSTKCPIVVYHSIYGFWLFLWYLLVIVLFVIRFTASGYSFGILWSLRCLSFDLRLLIIPLVSSTFACKGTFCTITIVRKKRRKMTSLPSMTSLPVTSLPFMTSLPVTWLTSLLVMASLPVMTSFPVAQSSSSNTHRVMMKNPIIF